MNRLKILVVDDAYFMRNLLKKELKEAGYDVVGEAKNGREGIKLYFELKPDIVTLDINMPDIDGIEVTKQILSKDPNAKILVVTGNNKEEIKEAILNAGAIAYLKKPFQPAFLWNKLEQIIVGEVEHTPTKVVEKMEIDVDDDMEIHVLSAPNEETSRTIVVKEEDNLIVVPEDAFDDDYYAENQLTRENLEKQERLERERLEMERLEQERLEKERLEVERLEQERLENLRIERIREENERKERDRLERERLEMERQRQYELQRNETQILEQEDTKTVPTDDPHQEEFKHAVSVGQYALPKRQYEETPFNSNPLHVNSEATSSPAHEKDQNRLDRGYIRPPRKVFSPEYEEEIHVEEPVLNKRAEKSSEKKGLIGKIKEIFNI